MRDREQVIQEEEYVFPYHHVVQNRRGFSQWFNDPWGINYLATIDDLLERLKRETFRSILDVGCGDGRFTAELMRAFPAARVAGVDFSPRAVALARAMVPDGSFHREDITSWVPDETFDLAVLMEVYEHIPPESAAAFVRAIARLLVPGGALYVTVPHVNKPLEPKHYRHFTLRSLENEFADEFEVTDVVPIERASIAKRLLDVMLSNPLFILNSPRVGRWIYDLYRRRLFLAGRESSCQRLIVRFRRRSP